MPYHLPHPYFQIRRGEEIGDRLVWRLPFNNPRIRAQLESAAPPDRPAPKQITLGYYRRSGEPGGQWSFVPLEQPLSIAALALETVRRRIDQDLAKYQANASSDTGPGDR